MKKVISLLLVSFALVSLMVACGSSSITITYGIKGEYGVSDEVREGEFLYQIPAGTYTAKFRESSTAKAGSIWVNKNEIITNSSGFDEYVKAFYSESLAPGSEIEITVNDGELVGITLNSSFVLTEVK